MLTPQEFVVKLSHAGIVCDATVATLRQEAERAETLCPRDFAARCVAAGHLTAFQVKQILSGREKGLTLGNYILLEELGSGGMGVVLRARHRRMGRDVAIKVLAGYLAKNTGSVLRFQQEVRAVAQLQHPNIVAAYDADQIDGTNFLVTEYVDGCDLAQLVKRKGPLAVDRSLDCVTQAARGLAYAHAKGVVHRDVKPSNLIIDKHGHVKVLDLGLARISNCESDNECVDITRSSAVMGTVDYMSPEQARQTKSADARSDIYSLGMTLHYLLTGKPGYTGDSPMARLLAHATQPIPVIQQYRDDVSNEVQRIFAKMVAKSPSDRYESMQAVIDDLQRYAAPTPVSCVKAPSSSASANSDTPIVRTEFGSSSKPARQACKAPRDKQRRVRQRDRVAVLAVAAVSLLLVVAVGLVVYRATESGAARSQPPRVAASRPIVGPPQAQLPSGRMNATDGPTFAGSEAAAIAAAERQATECVEAYKANPIGSNREGAHAALVTLRNLSEQSAVLMRLESQMAAITIAAAEKRASDRVGVYGEALAPNSYNEALEALSDLERLSPRSSQLIGLRSMLEEMAASQAVEQAEAIVAAYERDPADIALDDVMAAAATAIASGSDAVQPRLLSLRSRVETVLMQAIENFEVTPSDSTLQHALRALRYMSQWLQERSRVEEVQARVAAALIARIKGIPLEQSLEELELLSVLNANQATWDLANKAVVTRASLAMREALKNADYESALAAHMAIADRDVAEANRRANAWLSVLKNDYEKIPQSIVSQLPAPIISRFARTILVKFSAVQISAVPAVKNSIGMELKVLPPGRFIMGDSSVVSEQPVHAVTLTQPFMIGVYEVTREQYARVLEVPGVVQSNLAPQSISWEGAMEFCRLLSAVPEEHAAGRLYRLPTEAEWEYACRAGSVTSYGFGDSPEELGQYAWFSETAFGRARPVGLKRPNACGLYDMHGNVWEWCADWFGPYGPGGVVDPTGPAVDFERVLRGGACNSAADGCRSASRWNDFPGAGAGEFGFRVAVSIQDVSAM